MSIEDNINLVKKFYEFFTRQNGEQKMNDILQLLSEDVEWIVPGPRELSFVGVRHGREGVKEFFEIIGQMVTVKTYEPQKYVAQGDDVVVFGSNTAIAKNTGKTYENKWCHVFEIKDSKIHKFHQWYYVDALMEAFKDV